MIPAAGDKYGDLTCTGEISLLADPPCAVVICKCGRRRVAPIEWLPRLVDCGMCESKTQAAK